MNVELLYFDGCPHWRVVDERLQELASELGFEVSRVRVGSPDDAERLGFRGSPTVLVDGRDPFAAPGDPVAFACRVYRTLEGLAGAPSLAQLRAALTA